MRRDSPPAQRPADVIDLVADTFLALLESGGGFDPRRGSAAACVAHRQRVRTVRRETRIRQVAGRHGGQRQLDADMARIEEQVDASDPRPGSATTIRARNLPDV